VAAVVTSKTIVAEAVDAVSVLLGDLGFKRRQVAGVFTIDLGTGVLGWLGLNRATKRHSGAVEINPVIGVRHQEVERLVAELRGDRFHQFVPPTVSRPLGQLMPDGGYAAWLFESGSTAAAVELVRSVDQYGLPAMRSMNDLRELRRKIEEGWGFQHQLVYRLPVVIWLQGDAVSAIETLDASVGALGDRRDAAAEELRSFARVFRAYVSGER
jgi:hypothetical protein